MKRKKHLMFIFGLLFIINLLGYCVIQYQLEREASIEIEPKSLTEVNNEEDVNVTLLRSKDWPEGKFYHGVQYDVSILNDSSHQLTAWEITIPVPKKAKVTDSWNIVYKCEDDILTASPVDYNMIVEPHSQQTFGFILKTKEIEDIESLHAHFIPIYHSSDYPLFWANVAFTCILFISAIISIIVELRTASLRSQNLMDKHIIIQTMKTFSNFVDAKDPYTRGHSARVAYYSRELAKKLHLPDRDVELIYYIALLHDIGKVLIPDDILNKPGRLSPEEREIIETHTTKGAGILKDFDAIPGIADGARYHHEHYDGSGYPARLSGEDIPFLARIICVADSYDAMSSDRCYRPRLDNDTILDELMTNSGKQFDPEIVTAMLDLIKETNFFEVIEE